MVQVTLPETNIFVLKMDAWKTMKVTFQGRTVRLRRAPFLFGEVVLLQGRSVFMMRIGVEPKISGVFSVQGIWDGCFCIKVGLI